MYSTHTSGPGETSLTDLSNGLLTVTKNTGFFRFGVTAGVYAFPTVGQAVYPTTQAGVNTSLFGYVPSYYVAFVPNDRVTVSVGQLATLLGQEDGFTYQDPNVQRGLVWTAEPTFSRGVRFAYAQGKFSGDLEYNDGYYSGNHRAFEGLLGWAPSASTNLQVAFIAPQAGTPPNATASIANKTEYDLMVTQQVGKLQLMPYALFIDSPASGALGYTRNESATGLVLLADYAVDAHFSVGARCEWFANHSGTNDTSPNADFVGGGPGSRATTFTITPAYHAGIVFVRVEFSSVDIFGVAGAQRRILVESGVRF